MHCLNVKSVLIHYQYIVKEIDELLMVSNPIDMNLNFFYDQLFVISCSKYSMYLIKKNP